MNERLQSQRIRTLIVDDEALSRRGLCIRLEKSADFEVVGEAENGREALAAIRELQPDLVFLDIQMPGLSGFDVLKELPAETMPLIVFVTAYDKYAIQAFEAQAIDYLLKPVDDVRFGAALEHVREHFEQRQAGTQRDRLVGLIAEITGSGELALDDLLDRANGPLAGKHVEMLPIRQGRETVRVPAHTIEWIDAAGDYMCVHADGQTYVLRGTMKELEGALDPKLFQRVHRSTIVNLRRVRRLRAHMNGEYFLTLDGGHELKLSRSYRDKVEYFLKGARPN
jgi:two-component system LytT family response regulator